ncbi:hypothetical protein ACQ4PT_039199 [Festuca glaucescens]
MNGDGGRGGFNPGRAGFNPGRGGYGGGRGGYGNARGAFVSRGRHSQGPGRGGAGYGVGRGQQGNGYAGYGGGRNFVHGESSGSAGADAGQYNGNWGSSNVGYHRGGNFNSNNNRFGYGGNQQRWNTGRGGSYVNRSRVQETAGAPRSGIDADLLQQTVQAVVAAVTVATKASEPPAVQVPVATVIHDAGVVDGHHVGAPVAVPNPTVQQQKETAQVIREGNEITAKGKENEGQGPPKKKKEDKTGCFRCKKPGHYIDDCPTPFCDICESIHHATPACHLLNAPKPTATLHGYANEALMFFELPCGVFKAKAENPKLAKVTVDGAVLTIPEIIEQLKKIVPSEKFKWEVFHLKDNIFRVKLPMEEPLYMLPEVWVRVAVLRTKIGCLDHRLIPADSDMFIRRGFFKLRFEVEIDDHSQEVNMVDANNGFEGNDGANQGEGKNGGGHDMDMDNKGNDMDETSKDNEQDASSMHNGGEGMQEQLCNLDAIQIGTMHVKLAPPGILSDEKNLNKKEHFYTSLSHVDCVALRDEVGSEFHADSLSRGAASGFGTVGAREVGQQPAIGQVLPAGQLAQHAANGKPLHAGRQPLQGLLVPSTALSPGPGSHARDSQAAAGGHRGADTCGRAAGAGSSVTDERSLAAAVSPLPQTIRMVGTGGPGHGTVAGANHLPMIGTDAPGVAAAAVSEGFAVHDNGVGKGMTSVPNDGKNKNVVDMGDFQQCNLDFNSEPLYNEDGYYNAGLGLEPNLVGSLEQSKRGTTDKVLLHARGDLANMGIQDSVGIASSPMSVGKS